MFGVTTVGCTGDGLYRRPSPPVVRLVHIVAWRKRAVANPLLTAGQTRSRLLCTNLWMTCVKRRRLCVQAREMLGIAVPDHVNNRTFSWENTIHTLCIEED